MPVEFRGRVLGVRVRLEPGDELLLQGAQVGVVEAALQVGLPVVDGPDVRAFHADEHQHVRLAAGPGDFLGPLAEEALLGFGPLGLVERGPLALGHLGERDDGELRRSLEGRGLERLLGLADAVGREDRAVVLDREHALLGRARRPGGREARRRGDDAPQGDAEPLRAASHGGFSSERDGEFRPSPEASTMPITLYAPRANPANRLGDTGVFAGCGEVLRRGVRGGDCVRELPGRSGRLRDWSATRRVRKWEQRRRSRRIGRCRRDDSVALQRSGEPAARAPGAQPRTPGARAPGSPGDYRATRASVSALTRSMTHLFTAVSSSTGRLLGDLKRANWTSAPAA